MDQCAKNTTREFLVGCDFGAPLQASAQSKKVIALEAVRVRPGQYLIDSSGRNKKLVRSSDMRHWFDNCRGWTIPELKVSLAEDRNISLVAFDFPFSIPLALLTSAVFAERVDTDTFCTRANWLAFLDGAIDLTFESDHACAKLRIDPSVQRWRDKAFWCRRATDIATNAQPPLKDKYQNLFNMTVVGSKLLRQLSLAGMQVVLSASGLKESVERVAIETYPGAVARAIGVRGNYKQQPGHCVEAAEDYLKRQNQYIEFDPAIRKFCIEYRTAPNDHDAADALLCLITAICTRESLCEWHPGVATPEQLREEGCIVTPASLNV